MLASLTIKNVVLIDQLILSFREGFCALTGETGAGKSILLDALGLALGSRSDAGLVRKGTDQAQVSAQFEIANSHPAYALLAEAGIMIEPGEPLLLRRVVGADGRSRAFINDQPVGVALLKDIGSLLVEIHGQFDTHGLLDAKTHRFLLDDYAGVDGIAIEKAWGAWKEAERKLVAECEAMDKARAEEDYLRMAVEDLDQLSPEEGEEEKLSNLREKLMRREQVLGALNDAYGAVGESETLANAAYRLLERTGDDAVPLLEALDRATAELQDVSSQIQSMSADLEECEYSLEEIDERLFSLRGQARKHQCAVDDLARVRDELAGQLNNIEKQDDILSGLAREAETLKSSYQTDCEKVRKQRLASAEKLDTLVAKELPPLKLDKARFVTQVEPLPEEEWGPGGMDKIAFQVATNPGAEPGPLAKIASGGEMSRFMLALKVVMAETGCAGTLIFDEVDTGIGGSTAAAVGERLGRLAKTHQILVVTHAPQVAACAGNHYIVMKEGAESVNTTVLHLEQADKRREEIARMLAGASITDEARAAADKLLETGT